MTDYVLEVSQLSKDYGSINAVNSLSFSFERGQVYGILGPNGSGKTTTLAMLSGAVLPTAGSFSWFGESMSSNQRKRLGILLEKPNFYEYMSAKNNLKIIADIRGVDYSEIDTVLEQVGLYERRNSSFKTYSLGMKQRLAVGATLLGEPEVLILDEPTNGLDPEGIAEVRILIKELAEQGKTIILASHLLDEVQKVCSQVLVLKRGSKVYHGSVSGLEKDTAAIEVQAEDMKALEQVLLPSEIFGDFEAKDEMILIRIDKEVTTAQLNAYLAKHEIYPSHLAYKKESLEENIIELLK